MFGKHTVTAARRKTLRLHHLLTFSALCLSLAACDKVSPTGLLIAGSDVDDRVKMSHLYYIEHKKDFNFQSVVGGEYTFLVGADSHLTNDPGRMDEFFDLGISNGDLFMAHLGDIADTKAEYYINLDKAVQRAKEKYIAKHYEPVSSVDEAGNEHIYYEDLVTGDCFSSEEVRLPFYPVVGNHDITNNGWALWTDLFHSSFYTAYIHIGSVGDKDVYDYLVFLDTASGTLGREQIDLLDSEIFDFRHDTENEYLVRNVFVFGHTNIFRPTMTEFASTFTREETYYILQKFDDWQANIVFSGHVHEWDEHVVGNTTYLTLDTMCEKDNPAPGDYLVRVHVKPDGTYTWEKVRMNYTPKH